MSFRTNAGRGSNGHGVALFSGALVAESANATNLQVTTQPGLSGTTPYTLSPQPVVAAKKSLGTTDTAYVTNVVASLNVLSGSPVLSGTTTKTPVSGVATFTDLVVTGAGTWTITFTSGTLASAVSSTGTTTAVGNVAPNTPTISAGTPTSSGVTLTGSAFSDSDVGDTHAASQWQVTTAADTGYASPGIDTGDDATHKTSLAVTGLSASTDYIARVRYKDSAGNYSAWSANASFTTSSGTVNRADTFNRANSAVSLGTPSDGGSAYTPRIGTQGVTSNTAYQVASALIDSVTATLPGAFSTLTCSVNGTFKVDLFRDGGNNGAGGVVFRWASPGNFFIALQNGNQIYVYKVVSGSATLLYSGLSLNYPFTGFSNTLQVVLTATGYTVQTVDSVNGTRTEYGPIADTTGNDKVEHGPLTQDATVRLDNLSFVGA